MASCQDLLGHITGDAMDYEPADHVRTGGHAVAAWFACLLVAVAAFGIFAVDDEIAGANAAPVLTAGDPYPMSTAGHAMTAGGPRHARAATTAAAIKDPGAQSTFIASIHRG